MKKKLFRDYRLPLTLKFCLAVTSIVSGIFLIFVLLYYYIDFLGPRHWPKEYELGFQYKLYHPEIFIPEMIILFIIGFLIIYIMKWQIKTRKDNEQVNTLLLWLSIWAFIFIILFVPGFIIAHDFFGRYTLLGSGFGIAASMVVSISSIFIVSYLRKISNGKSQKEQKDKQIRKLLNTRVLNFNFILMFMIVLILISFIMLFVLEEVTPSTAYRITLEDELNEQRLGLPGTNVTINLTVEIIEGPGTINVAILENENRNWTSGYWTVSPQAVVVRPNEVKTITFICNIPQNASEGRTYMYNSSDLVVFEELQPHTFFSPSVYCRVTYDINEYDEAQSRLESSSSLWTFGGITQQSICMKLIELALLFIFSVIVITVLFEWNEFISKDVSYRI